MYSALCKFSESYFREIKYMDMNGSWQSYLLIIERWLPSTALGLIVVHPVPSKFPLQSWGISFVTVTCELDNV